MGSFSRGLATPESKGDFHVHAMLEEEDDDVSLPPELLAALRLKRLDELQGLKPRPLEQESPAAILALFR